MITAEIRMNLNFPDFKNIQEDLMLLATRVIIPDIQQGIHARKAIDGGVLPRNEPATIKRKGSDRPLIETGTLLVSPKAQKVGQSSVKISLGSERRAIGKHLQIDGVKTNHGLKFYRFFGISKDAETQCMNYMKKRIAEEIKRA